MPFCGLHSCNYPAFGRCQACSAESAIARTTHEKPSAAAWEAAHVTRETMAMIQQSVSQLRQHAHDGWRLDAHAKTERAFELLGIGMTADALAILREVVDGPGADPGNLYARLALARAYRQLGNTEDAFCEYDAAVKLLGLSDYRDWSCFVQVLRSLPEDVRQKLEHAFVERLVTARRRGATVLLLQHVALARYSAGVRMLAEDVDVVEVDEALCVILSDAGYVDAGLSMARRAAERALVRDEPEFWLNAASWVLRFSRGMDTDHVVRALAAQNVETVHRYLRCALTEMKTASVPQKKLLATLLAPVLRERYRDLGCWVEQQAKAAYDCARRDAAARRLPPSVVLQVVFAGGCVGLVLFWAISALLVVGFVALFGVKATETGVGVAIWTVMLLAIATPAVVIYKRDRSFYQRLRSETYDEHRANWNELRAAFRSAA